MPNIVITGATKGIGKAIAVLFASQGWNLALSARTATDLNKLEEELRKLSPNSDFILFAGDMSKQEDIQRFAKTVSDKWSALDVLINNAGVFLQTSLTENPDDQAFIKMIDTNLYSAYFATNSFLPLIASCERSPRHIFNMASIASLQPYGAYSVSKFALLGYSKVLREELKTKHIRVTAIMPGATLTPSWDGVNLPEERFMPAEDIAKAVWDIFCMSDRTVVEEIVLRPQLGDI